MTNQPAYCVNALSITLRRRVASMTRKHFAMIAQVIKETGASPEARANLAQRFASELATTNPNQQ